MVPAAEGVVTNVLSVECDADLLTRSIGLGVSVAVAVFCEPCVADLFGVGE